MIKNKRTKICFFTGTRAEFGLLSNLMHLIKKDKNFELQTIVTGTHTSKKFGLTINEIKKEGFKINKKIITSLISDTSVDISRAMSKILKQSSLILKQLNPDLLILLGDRYEALAIAIASMFENIPIAHFHGGESTEGLYDEAFRHAITKMSYYHFAAHKNYKKKIIQLGEDSKRIFIIGGMGVDTIKNQSFYTKDEIEDKLKIKFNKKNLIVTFHPITLEKNNTEKHIDNLLASLFKLKDTLIIFTSPNADTENNIIIKKILKFIKNKKNNYKYFKSLGTKMYLSTLKNVDAIIGNSSSGLLEAPTFKIGTINIGERQGGRLKSESVINCKPDEKSISRAINKLYSSEFQRKILSSKNPYGKGKASLKAYNILKNINITKNIKKSFNVIK